MTGQAGEAPIQDGTIDGTAVTWKVVVPAMALTITFAGTVDGDSMAGQAELGAFGAAPFTGTKA